MCIIIMTKQIHLSCGILFFLLASAVFCQSALNTSSSLILDSIPPIPSRIFNRMLQYQNTRSVSIQGWDAWGKGLFITTRFGETNQVHYVQKPSGMRRQITFFDEPVYYAYPCPDSSVHGFLFETDVGGSEYTRICFFDTDKSITSVLTDTVSKSSGVVWSHKGDLFAYTSTKRNARDFDIYVKNIRKPGEELRLSEKQGSWSPVCWSFDDKKLVISEYISANESKLYLLDPATKESSPLIQSDVKALFTIARWSRDGKVVYYVSDEQSEFLRLRALTLSTGKSEVLTASIPWNIMELEISPDGKTVAFTTNEHGFGSLYLYTIATKSLKKIPRVPAGRIYNLRFHPVEYKLAFVVSGAQTPGDAYLLDCKTSAITQWTFSETGGLNPAHFVVPTVFYYETFDSVDGKPRTIPALMYKPKTGSGPFPVLIKIHGGPESQYWPTFDPEVQYWIIEMGIAVIAPNVRGSAGYGKTYLTLDNGFNREGAVKDIGTLLSWITKQTELDTSRIAVMGGSYGGFMTLSCMTRYADKLACGIDLYGISNFITFLKSTNEYRRDLRRVEYGDERDSAMSSFLQKISPVYHSRNITKPLLIFQGANDPRVPQGESEQMVAAIRKNKGIVWYMLAKDEGHGIGKKQNRDVLDAAVVLFLERFLVRKSAK